MQIAFRIPLNPHRRLCFRPGPIHLTHPLFRTTRSAVRQGPLKAFQGNVYRKNSALICLFIAPTCPIHHPEKRRLNPGHSVHLERRRDKRTLSQSCVSDLVAEGLIDTNSVVVIHCSYFILLDFSHRALIGIRLFGKHPIKLGQFQLSKIPYPRFSVAAVLGA